VASRIRAIRAAVSSGVSDRNGGVSAPTIRNPGNRFSNNFPASAATPGAPPSRKTRPPRGASRPHRAGTRSDPATRSGSGARVRRDAHTRGAPSATRKAADRFTRASEGFSAVSIA
jgi:hypothetical protein